MVTTKKIVEYARDLRFKRMCRFVSLLIRLKQNTIAIPTNGNYKAARKCRPML